MSNSIYPVLPGLDITASKVPELKTLIHAAVSGRESRMQVRDYPIWYFTLKYNFLRDQVSFPELTQLGGFYLSMYAAWDNFLFTDQDDNTVTDQAIGTGNGSQTDFQLARPFGAFVEPVFNPNVITNVKVSGSSVSYTNLGSGVVRCASPPASSAPVTATFSYYFRCRFKEDKLSFDRFMYQLWQFGKVELVGSLQDKI